jgi:hypothetical protein
VSPAEVRKNIVPNLAMKHLHWTGQVNFDGVANGARAPLMVNGEPGAGDYIYVLKKDPETVQFYWNRFGVGNTPGITLPLEKGRWYALTVNIDFQNGLAQVEVDGAPALTYQGPIFTSMARRIEIGWNDIGVGYINSDFGGSIRETDRQVDY